MMGILSLTLVAATKMGAFEQLPVWLHFLRTFKAATPEQQAIALGIKGLCAANIAAGTVAGGWLINPHARQWSACSRSTASRR